MTVTVKFRQSGQFSSGDFKSLDLGKISRLQLNHLRNTCELLAISSENPRPGTPYVITTRDNPYEIEAIIRDLQQLKTDKRDLTYEITETQAHLITK
jgi:hypothetical protein